QEHPQPRQDVPPGLSSLLALAEHLGPRRLPRHRPGAPLVVRPRDPQHLLLPGRLDLGALLLAPGLIIIVRRRHASAYTTPGGSSPIPREIARGSGARLPRLSAS